MTAVVPLLRRHQAWLMPLAVGLVAVALALALLGRDLGAWGRLPFMYEWDAVCDLALAQAGVEGPWPSASHRLGAPGLMDRANYPIPEVGQLAVVQALSLLGLSAPGIINAYFLLTFFLCAATATWALRRLQVRDGFAVAAALVFACLPAHFWRGTVHTFVNGYYWVPLLCLLLLRFWRGDAVTLKHSGVCLIAPVINVYYSFFFAVLLAGITLLESINGRGRSALLRAGRLAVALGAGFMCAVARALGSYAEHKMSFVRRARDSEVFGLKIVQMVLPAFSTVSDYLAHAADDYRHTAPLQNENRWADLGLVGACAFLVTLAAMVALAGKRERSSTVLRAGTCTLLCILYGTVGGFGATFSFLISPFIRSTNRIEVFIAFFSLLAAAWIGQRRVPVRADWPVALAVVVLLGWDLHHKDLRPDYAHSEARYVRDAVFFSQLEARLPQGARIYQLPQIAYPEGGVARYEYDQFRPFLHTRALVWSFGAVRGSPAEHGNDAASDALAAGDAQGLHAYLLRNGFSGILLNRRIAAALGMDPGPALTAVYGAPVVADDVGEFAYYAVKAP